MQTDPKWPKKGWTVDTRAGGASVGSAGMPEVIAASEPLPRQCAHTSPSGKAIADVAPV